jgi:hypothetical protein
MAERPDCLRTGQLIPELAIGVAAGDERAGALGHLARCVRCRGGLESATAAADALLLLAPEREPPPGFETRVLTGLPHEPAPDIDALTTLTAEPEPRPRPRTPEPLAPRPGSPPGMPAARPPRPPGPPRPPERPRRRLGLARLRPPRAGPARWPGPSRPPGPPRASAAKLRTALLRTAVTVTIAGLVGSALWWRTGDDRRLADGYRDTLAIAHGRYMHAAPLLTGTPASASTSTSASAGYMVAYEGEPSWIVVVVRAGDVSGGYAVRLITRDGRPIPLGTMAVAHGQGSWFTTISLPVEQIAAVALTRPHAPDITARLG